MQNFPINKNLNRLYPTFICCLLSIASSLISRNGCSKYWQSSVVASARLLQASSSIWYSSRSSTILSVFLCFSRSCRKNRSFNENIGTFLLKVKVILKTFLAYPLVSSSPSHKTTRQIKQNRITAVSKTHLQFSQLSISTSLITLTEQHSD